jgi:hypothetical protein
LYSTLTFPNLPLRTSIFRTRRGISIAAGNAGRINPTTKAITRKKRRKGEVLCHIFDFSSFNKHGFQILFWLSTSRIEEGDGKTLSDKLETKILVESKL